jgi:hypothetical protein
LKEAFVHYTFAGKSLQLVQQAVAILDAYVADGYRLTLRQLYYQFISKGLLENKVQNYKRLGDVLNNARLAGLVDWDYIEDRSRETQFVSHWESPADVIDTAAAAFRRDKWKDQPWYVELQVEKQALEGILIPVCQRLDIGFSANRGYSSSTTLYETGKRLHKKHRQGKQILVIYLGDHDPSGIDMTRDIEERLETFARCRIRVNRIALNMSQVEEYNPPENPAKTSDSRYEQYITRFGESSWELDALEPRLLARLVTEAVEEVRDEDLWNEAVTEEKKMRTMLKRFAKDYREGNIELPEEIDGDEMDEEEDEDDY